MRNELSGLFSPFSCKSLDLANRFVMSPMTRQFSPGGVPDENVAEYYARRARADVALIVTEGVGVDHPSALGQGSMEEKDIPVLHGEDAMYGWREVVDRVHEAGGKIVPQLWHMGAIRQEGTGPHPEARSLGPANMSEGEIADVIAAFVRSAENAKAVGFDGIALHGGHGYLLDSFLWNQTNTRDDEWGGDATRRLQFPVKLIDTDESPSFSLPIRPAETELFHRGLALAGWSSLAVSSNRPNWGWSITVTPVSELRSSNSP